MGEWVGVGREWEGGMKWGENWVGRKVVRGERRWEEGVGREE